MSAVIICCNCGKELSRHSKRKGPRCRSCLAVHLSTDPEARAKARETLARTLSDPAVRRRRAKAVSEGMKAKMRSDPAFAQMQREKGRELGKSGAAHRAHPAGSESRVRAGRAISKHRRRGIPAAYYEDYRRMVHTDHIPADEARRLVLELQEADRKRKIKAREAGQRLAVMGDEDRIRLGSAVLGMAFARAAAKGAR